MALSGKVAIIRNGAVAEVRDLGPTPIPVKRGASVLPFVEVYPNLGTDEQLTGYSDAITENEVTRTWTKTTVIPDRVTSRQFKMQLEKDGLLSSVEAWIGQQPKLVQIAYANSGTFVRDEPMMQAGFTALGFQTAQIDAFFKAASAL